MTALDILTDGMAPRRQRNAAAARQRFGGLSPIESALQRIEDEMFPESQKRARLRLVHWAHCDFALKYRERAKVAGTLRVAKQLRKQGFGLNTALSVLARRDHV